MDKRRLALGLDMSTQSLSAVVLDIDSQMVVLEHSLDYARDPRLNIFGIRQEDYLLHPETEGEAAQPPQMFLASLDALFSDLRWSLNMEEVVVLNTSSQQHGHLYLNQSAFSLFSELNKVSSAQSSLVNLLGGSLAYSRAPIWMTSNTGKQADLIRNSVGGREELIKISGSDAQLRFTGLVIRKVAEEHPDVYRQTSLIHLISSLVTAVLTGNPEAPIDFGNGCGMCLMDYARRDWSEELIRAISAGLPGGREAFRQRLPAITAPDTVVGNIATYFVRKYGFHPACVVAAGSGDNPQSKVLVKGDLLSLGTSLVNMVATDGKTLDMSGAACAMYDGTGRPFMFGCRTNGALVWARIRASYGLDKDEYEPAEKALETTPLGQNLIFWQPRNESFPLSGSFDLLRAGNALPSLGTDYAGVIESSLAAVYFHSRNFSQETGEPLHVTGGASRNREIIRRVSAIWKRPVIPVKKAGAATGAAVAGVSAFIRSKGGKPDIEPLAEKVIGKGQVFQASWEDIAAFHGSGGYLSRFAVAEADLIRVHPL